jgi:methylated-DNA-[protein]-cysteine S-methyltransferase
MTCGPTSSKPWPRPEGPAPPPERRPIIAPPRRPHLFARAATARSRSGDNRRVTDLEWASLSTPVGPVSVGCTSSGVARVRFGPPPAQAGGGRSAPAAGAAHPERDATAGTLAERARAQLAEHLAERARAQLAEYLAGRARAQLAEYLAGRRRAFELPLDWSGCSPVQRRVLGTLFDTVGYGQTVSYGELAGRSELPADIELPARAVGQVMGSNPIPVIVPCHRVLASDGLGGYSGGAGLEVKRWLLILEGALPPTLDWVPARADA